MIQTSVLSRKKKCCVVLCVDGVLPNKFPNTRIVQPRTRFTFSFSGPHRAAEHLGFRLPDKSAINLKILNTFATPTPSFPPGESHQTINKPTNHPPKPMESLPLPLPPGPICSPHSRHDTRDWHQGHDQTTRIRSCTWPSSSRPRSCPSFPLQHKPSFSGSGVHIYIHATVV